jgi:hypothetical protein
LKTIKRNPSKTPRAVIERGSVYQKKRGLLMESFNRNNRVSPHELDRLMSVTEYSRRQILKFFRNQRGTNKLSDTVEKRYKISPVKNCDILESFFDQNSYPTWSDCEELAESSLNSLNKVTNFFRRKRYMLRKSGKTLTRPKKSSLVITA